jgi:hypothetical protein
MLGLFFLIIVAGYSFLEYYFRRHSAKITWYDRFVGGVGGILLLTGLWIVLNATNDLETPGAYIFVAIVMAAAIGLGSAAWLAITRRK